MHFAAPSASDIGGLPKKQEEIRCAGPLARRRGPEFYGCFMKPAAGLSGAKQLPFWAEPVRRRIACGGRAGFFGARSLLRKRSRCLPCRGFPTSCMLPRRTAPGRKARNIRSIAAGSVVKAAKRRKNHRTSRAFLHVFAESDWNRSFLGGKWHVRKSES